MRGRWRVWAGPGRSLTFVRRSMAAPAERDGALSPHEAQGRIEALFGRISSSDGATRRTMIEISGASVSDAHLYALDRLRALVKDQVGPIGPMLLVASGRGADRPGACKAGDDETEGQGLVRTVMAGRDDLPFEGRNYRVAEATSDGYPNGDRFQVMPADEASKVIARIRARPGISAAERDAWGEIAERLVDGTARGGTSGIVLLRRLVQRQFQTNHGEPALTPSMLRELAPRKATIEIRFVEVGSGRPLADLPLLFTAPGGAESRVTTTSAGVAKLAGLDPGACVVTSIIDGATVATSYVAGKARDNAGAPAERGTTAIEPAYLVDVAEHRVKTGDTPDSIAGAEGAPWDTIARFNWETTDPDELEEMYRGRVGCTETTPDGESYRFDDGDDPGIILIPRPWESSFTVGSVSTVHVSPLRTVYISLENELGLPVPGARYEVVFADGSERQGRLGGSGIARLAGVPEGAFSVSYPDDRDLLARSLAASVRAGFDEQETGALFFLLGQSQEVVDQAVGVYAEYLDDLSGEGLAADIDQVVTDPDARPPLVFLCALAGLPIEGAAGVDVQNSSSAGERAGGDG